MDTTVELTKRQEEIARTALQLVAREGYAALSMREVAKRLDIKLASLQYHVATKHELLQLTVGYVNRVYREDLDEMVEDMTVASRVSLRRVLEDLLVFTDDADDFGRFEIQFQALAAIDPDIAQLWQQFCINYEDSVARLVAAALPDLTAAECRSRAELVIALIEGTTMQFEPKSVAAQKRHTKRVIDLAERIVFE